MQTYLSYLRRNRQLLIGIALLLGMTLAWFIGYLYIDPDHARPLSGPPDMPPSVDFLLGTDSAGRQMLPVMIAGTPMTLKLGLIAGTVGLLIGTILGFTAGYFGGLVDTIIRGVADVALTVPALAVLVVIASVITQLLTVEIMALIVASLAWMWPTRTIRAQVLSMREQTYVQIAQLSGMSNLKIIFQELMPNLLPYLAASFVGAVAAAVLAAIGLEALGLGPQSEPTLGMTIFWAIFHGALLRGMWWWWAPPMVVIILLFIGLFLVAAGLDEVANPRLRRAQDVRDS
ncbi:ABC transporter permease [Chloroflexi bacterium TSY]|nr:ABC transporter permease [Chloroflexi bacterium TSY]